jgi:hypothetical protein
VIHGAGRRGVARRPHAVHANGMIENKASGGESAPVRAAHDARNMHALHAQMPRDAWVEGMVRQAGKRTRFCEPELGRRFAANPRTRFCMQVRRNGYAHAKRDIGEASAGASWNPVFASPVPVSAKPPAKRHAGVPISAGRDAETGTHRSRHIRRTRYASTLHSAELAAETGTHSPSVGTPSLWRIRFFTRRNRYARAPSSATGRPSSRIRPQLSSLKVEICHFRWPARLDL